MTQDELKKQVAQAAMRYVLANVPKGSVIGVGTGSTVNYFIDALAQHRHEIAGAVSSSKASTTCLQQYGMPVLELNEITNPLPIYVDGADEINANGAMIKGGGAALTREKIVAEAADKFLCIADESKYVQTLGTFPLPIEVIPMASALIIRKIASLGGQASLRMSSDQPVLTDNQQYILDVKQLQIVDPDALEATINAWPGVVTVGLFAKRKADICLLGGVQGVKQYVFV